MSKKEVGRVKIVERLIRKEIGQYIAADVMGVSRRQVQRIVKRYREFGVEFGVDGLVHRNRGSVSHRKICGSKIEGVLSKIREQYPDFGPTLAHEKLTELGVISFSKERLRMAMIQGNIWKPKAQRMKGKHPSRPRRGCFGELIQIDGSMHRWFEERNSFCTLLAYIDDATSYVVHAQFVDRESTFSYFEATRSYINKYGKPFSIYSDKHSIFRINTPRDGSANASDSQSFTQFGRAMDTLNIHLLHAPTPQAKGRIERLFNTLQDRLVKELRIRNISDIDQANAFLPSFLDAHNAKFAVPPSDPVNMHSALDPSENLDAIFVHQEIRVLSKNLTCQFQNKTYQIHTHHAPYLLRNAKITVSQSPTGSVALTYKDRPLDFAVLTTYPISRDTDSKSIVTTVDSLRKHSPKKTHIPGPFHPWRNVSKLPSNTATYTRSTPHLKCDISTWAI